MMKYNCHRLKYLILCYKRVIALILRNIVPRSISYYTRKLVQYDILLATIFLNVSAITQYRSRCNICNLFGYVLLFRYNYKEKLVKILTNIAFLFYKDIYMKYLILHYKTEYFWLHNLTMFNIKMAEIILNTCCKEIWWNVIVTDWDIWYYIIKG
jgi:hypothetical protein